MANKEHTKIEYRIMSRPIDRHRRRRYGYNGTARTLEDARKRLAWMTDHFGEGWEHRIDMRTVHYSEWRTIR